MTSTVLMLHQNKPKKKKKIQQTTGLHVVISSKVIKITIGVTLVIVDLTFI
jgi:hypothetical protein